MKRIRSFMITLIVLLITSIVGTIMVHAEPQKTFTDVIEDWQIEAVNWGVNEGIVQGYTDGTFRPNSELTEAEFATMMARFVTNIDVNKLTPVGGSAHWSQHIYNELNKYKLPFQGYSNTKTKDSSITRGQIAQIVAAKNGFNLTLEQAIEYMYENDLSNGMIPGVKTFESYGAKEFLTRAQATAFLKRLSEKKVTTFRGVESPVKGNEMGGINNGGLKFTDEKDFHKAAETVAAKYGFTAEKASEGVQLRNSQNKVTVAYSNGSYRSTKEYYNVTIDLIQSIENLSSSSMSTIKASLDESLKDYQEKVITVEGRKIQLKGTGKGEIRIMFLTN